MRAIIVIAIIAQCAAQLQATARAHGDEPLLYVAQSGDDRGLCNDALAPCRTLAHAVQQAGKGTQIRVAAGAYDASSADVLFHVLSGVVDVRGGFDPATAFAQPTAAGSTLIGVPLQYRALLAERGFHVIVDQKGSPAVSAQQTDKMLAVHRQLKSGATIEPCVAGMAGQLPCDNVDLLAHIAFNDLRARPSAANDIWGFTDLNSGIEYIVAGFNTGTAVFDLSDPENPREVGFVNGQNSVWRDVKILQRFDAARGRWQTYAYVTTDASTDGLFVIDLGGLPQSIARATYQSDFQSNHNVLLTNTDPATGLAQDGGAQFLLLAGSNRSAGQIRAYALDNPGVPVLAQGNAIADSFGAGDRSYAHDLAALRVRDVRATQCPNATAACDVVLDFNEQNIEVWDMTDIADPQRLNPGRQEYAQRGYVHSGWPSEDGQFMFVQDELDERDFGIDTRLRVFSLADLQNPQEVGAWNGPTNAIDHNGFVRGNRYYMSNYSRGLTVLDITDATSPVESGRIDTFPFSDAGGFVGAWGVYPYFLSATLAVSDIDSGVYLLRDRTRNVAQGMLEFDRASFAAVEGQDVSLTVRRLGGTSGTVRVDFEIVHGTTGTADISASSGTLSWTDGDGGDRSIVLTTSNDGVGEGLEMLLVRLIAPAGGATLGDRHSAYVYVGDPGDSTGIAAFASSIAADENGFGRAVIVVQRSGDASNTASVDFAISGGDASPGNDFSGPDSGTIVWPAGDALPKTIVFEIVSDGVAEAEEFFDVSFGNAVGGTLTGNGPVRVTIAANGASNSAPLASAPASLTVAENTAATLDGSQSSDPDGDPLTYQWNQTSGPTVSLANPGGATATFSAPDVTATAILRFQLRVTDSGGLSATASTAVTVTDSNASVSSDSGGGGAATWLLMLALGWWRMPSRTDRVVRSCVPVPHR